MSSTHAAAPSARERPASPPDPAPPPSYAFGATITDVFRRRTRLGTWVFVTEVFIGLGWLRAATEKLISPAWWRGDELGSFLDTHADASLPWFRPVLAVVDAHTVAVSLLVIVLQVMAGTLVLGGRRAGLAVGIALNLSFVAAGAVNPSAFYLLAQGSVALAAAEAARRPPRRRLDAAQVAAASLAIMSLPFISTIDPAVVVDDPAVMMVMLGALTVGASEWLLRATAEAGEPGGHAVAGRTPTANSQPAHGSRSGRPPHDAHRPTHHLTEEPT